MRDGDGGIGTAAAPKLTGVGALYDREKLLALLNQPNARMIAGGMPATNLKKEDMQALIAYVRSLK